MTRGLCLLFVLLPSAFCFLPSAAADEPASKSAAVDDDLFDGLIPAKPTKEEPKDASAADTILPGEDIDLGDSKDPFARIATKMQRSQQALSAGNSREETQDLQKEIVTDLDALLKSLEKKCAGGNCKKPGNSSSSSSGAKPSSKPANDSTARVGKPGDASSEESDAADVLREVWGHLPPKVREAMQNASLEEFLPKYDRLIEEFYRRLAEQPARGN